MAHDVLVGQLIVVTGPPGAGKTTVSRILSRLFEPSARIAGDEFFGFIDQGFLAPWTAPAHRQNGIVIGAAAAAAGRLATGGYAVIYDGVIGPSFFQAFCDATGLPFLHYAILLPPERMCRRAADGVPGMPVKTKVLQKMADTKCRAGPSVRYSVLPVQVRTTLPVQVRTTRVAVSALRSRLNGGIRIEWTGLSPSGRSPACVYDHRMIEASNTASARLINE